MQRFGVTVTYPFDFIPVSENGVDQNLESGIYTVLWELEHGTQSAYDGFVGQDDSHAQDVTP